MIRLNDVIRNIAWAGKFFTASSLSAPRYCDTIEDIALRVCPNTQMSMDKKVVTIPTAAKEDVALDSILPIMAASVNDKTGSDIPAIRAGIASLLICFNVIVVLKILTHNNKRALYFVSESKYYPGFLF